MQIQAYRRTERTPVNLFGIDLMFEPNTAGHVVAEVTDERACERLLSISDAYREYLGEGQPVAVTVAPAPAPVAVPVVPPGGSDDDANDDTNPDAVLLGSESLPADFTVGEQTITQAQVVELAFARSGMNREEWNLNDEDDREALIEGEVTKLVLAEEQRVQAAQAAEAAKADTAPPADTTTETPAVNPLLIRNEAGETLDLGTLTETKLREFANANNIALPGGKSTKVGDLRLMVAKALTQAA